MSTTISKQSTTTTFTTHLQETSVSTTFILIQYQDTTSHQTTSTMLKPHNTPQLMKHKQVEKNDENISGCLVFRMSFDTSSSLYDLDQ